MLSLWDRFRKYFRMAFDRCSHRYFLLKRLPRDSIGAEIGVHKGGFSAQILRTVSPKELHLVDPWKYEESDLYKKALYGGKARGGQSEMDARCNAVCARFDSNVRAGQVVIHRGDSSSVLSGFPNDYFDWIYIDGNHLYEYVKQDLEMSFHKVKPGGLITGDDYAYAGWWQGGVKRAVDEFIEERSVKVVRIKGNQFIIKNQKSW